MKRTLNLRVTKLEQSTFGPGVNITAEGGGSGSDRLHFTSMTHQPKVGEWLTVIVGGGEE